MEPVTCNSSDSGSSSDSSSTSISKPPFAPVTQPCLQQPETPVQPLNGVLASQGLQNNVPDLPVLLSSWGLWPGIFPPFWWTGGQLPLNQKRRMQRSSTADSLTHSTLDDSENLTVPKEIKFQSPPKSSKSSLIKSIENLTSSSEIKVLSSHKSSESSSAKSRSPTPDINPEHSNPPGDSESSPIISWPPSKSDNMQRPFKCPNDGCEKSYTRRFHLARHINQSHSPQVGPKETHSCELCHKNFSNIYAKKKHLIHVHKGDRYSCKDCGQIFRKQQHLKTHSYVHTGIKPYKCEFPGCGSAYTVPSLLKRHSIVHKKGKYVCPYDECYERMDTYTELRHHLTDAHPKVCDICQQEFKHLCRLKAHLLTHENFREVVFCPFTPCERYYFDEKNLNSHIRRKHNENFKGFECSLCNKMLSTRQTLQRHLKIHTHPVPSEKKPRKKTLRTNYAKLLSGYVSEEEQDGESRMLDSVEMDTHPDSDTSKDE